LLQIENTQVLVKNQIDMEQSQSTLTFSNNLETLKSQRANMDLAQEVYNVLSSNISRCGVEIEVINADASFKEAQTNYYAALYDALIASVDLEKSFGKYWRLPIN